MSEKEPLFLYVDAMVRYWEDAKVNGVRDTDGSLIPLKWGDLWKPVINIETGQVRDWPVGTVADIHYKVCDQGEYWIGDADGSKLLKYDSSYVPDCLGVEDDSFGDYIIMRIGPDGVIPKWRTPDLSDRWEPVRAE